MNLILIHGRLVRDPEQKTIGENTVTNFTVAVDNEFSNTASFFNVAAWGKRGDVIMAHFHKGQEILVRGRHESRTIEKDGEKRTYWQVQMDSFDFCGKKSDNAQSESKPVSSTADSADAFSSDNDDDMPF
jgi:single-strand DNA-binding protein